MIDCSKRILFLGYGSVAQCTLPILLKHIRVPAKNITVIDFEDVSGELRGWIAKGVRFVRDRVTPRNLGSLLGKHLRAGDVLIDLETGSETMRFSHREAISC